MRVFCPFGVESLGFIGKPAWSLQNMLFCKNLLKNAGRIMSRRSISERSSSAVTSSLKFTGLLAPPATFTADRRGCRYARASN